MHVSKSSITKILVVLFSLTYAAMICYFFQAKESMDSINYIIYANNSAEIFDGRLERSGLFILFNEPLWLLVNMLIRLHSSLDADEIITLLSFFIALSFAVFASWQVKTRKDAAIAALLLLSPFVISNFVIHLRLGLAAAIFMFAYYLRNRKISVLVMLATPLIHSGFFIFTMLYFICMLLARNRYAFGLRIIFLTFSIILISILIGKVTLFEVKQSEVDITNVNASSGLGFIYFSFVLLILIYFQLKSRFTLIPNQIHVLYPFAILIFYLLNYFIFYGAGRFMEMGMLMIFVLFMSLSEKEKLPIILILAPYVAFDISSRLSLGNYGF
jgi:hypothetical protein